MNDKGRVSSKAKRLLNKKSSSQELPLSRKKALVLKKEIPSLLQEIARTKEIDELNGRLHAEELFDIAVSRYFFEAYQAIRPIRELKPEEVKNDSLRVRNSGWRTRHSAPMTSKSSPFSQIS